MEGYVGAPRNGRQCYRKLNHNIRYVEHIPASQSSYYFIQPLYSDLDIQVFVNIIKGSLDVFVSNSSQTFKVTVNSTTWEHSIEGINDLSEQEDIVFSYLDTNEGVQLKFSHEQYNLEDEQFYFVVLSKNIATDYNIIFYQAALKLNWFSIIVLFVCLFVIAFLGMMMVIYVKRQWDIHKHQRLYKYITNRRISRPFSKMSVLVNRDVFARQKDKNITDTFCHASSSAKSKQTISLIPLSVQPTSDSKAFINTVLIQLPKSDSGHINFSSGVYLSCNNLSNNGSRLQTKVTPL